MLEEVVHDSGVIISAARSYVCSDRAEGHFRATINRFYIQPVRSARDIKGETQCAVCGQGPMLWDHYAQLSYTLQPFIITEEEL